MKKFLNEFKTFALKGNVLDMAVGVIIGGAFGKIVASLVSDIIMPFVGLLLGGLDFKSLKWIINPAVIENGVVVSPEAAVMYGSFLQNTVDFIIIALSVFIFVKIINDIGKKLKQQPKTETETEVIAPTTEELLTEIRDLMKNK